MAVSTPSRRQFLIASGATLAGIAVSSSGFANFAPYYAYHRSGNPLTGKTDPFTLGVASGSPTANGFILWTRLAPDPLSPDSAAPGGIALKDHPLGIALDVEIAADPAMRHVLRQGTALAEAAHGFSVHLPVDGLTSDRPYWYRFHLGPYTSAVGSARTLPRAGRPADRLTLGFTSCANFERGYFSGYRHLAAEQPDLVLMLGDYIYEQVEQNRPVLRRHSDNAVPTTLDGYRRRYAQYRLDPDLQNLHATAPTLVTWDDHEVENDYAGDWSENFAPPAAFARRRQAAYRAFYEHMPVRNRPHAAGLDIYDSVTVGDLARVSLLDGRQYRSRGACYAAPGQGGGHQVDSRTCPELMDPSRSMLGLRQEQWLGGNLATSPARWNIVAQNVIMAELDARDAAGTVTAWTDAWDGYPLARRRLLEQLTRARNPVVFSGDIHSFWNNDLMLDGRTVASEFVTSSITSDGPPQAHLQAMLDAHPHVHFAESRKRGYSLVEMTGGTLTSHFRTVSHVGDPQASLATLRSFVIEDGRVGAAAA
ncbi:alkaline phosphatase D family protein [Dongia rigui]|uniref:Alkaline phosphatase D family protein n=1 Tax=Dongia rigui TaxID=940149 RepID=A0ABU5E0Y5_9PROT|nr:alkaline phosphatase D family protein [Dongia rigui]MDY0872884.1 alkaline phosphatase D family protein [Dongia rigui]